MEADINVIVDVDPDEAQVLIELAELLFDEWYVAREQRQQRLQKLGLIAAEKKALQQQKALPAPEATSDAASEPAADASVRTNELLIEAAATSDGEPPSPRNGGI
jgi:hypothetical protein